MTPPTTFTSAAADAGLRPTTGAAERAAARPPREDRSAPLRVAVVGLGYWGPSVVRNLLSVDDCHVAALVDTDPARVASVRRSAPGVRASSWPLVLQDETIGAVVLATPASTHYELARAALDAGKDVLVEKPLTLDSDQARRLVTHAEKGSRILMVGHTYTYQPAIRCIRDLMRNGQAGKPLYIDSVRANLGIFRSDTNVLYDLAAHDVSVLDFLLGEPPIGVRCSAFSVIEGQPESLAYLLLTYRSGVIAHLHVNWLSPRKLRQIIVGCDQKMLVYDDTSATEKVKVYDAGVRPTIADVDPAEDDRTTWQRRVEVRSGDMWAPHLDAEESLRIQCRAFLDAVRTRVPPLADGRCGLRVVRVLEAAQSSAHQGGNEVVIGPDEVPAA